MAVKPIPEGYRTITAQLSLDGAANTIEFYKYEPEEQKAAQDASVAQTNRK